MAEGAFTLIELLLVVAILGIALAAVVPRLGGLVDGGQAAVASRTLAQSGRYARSMALLNQVPVDLVLFLDESQVRVEVAKDGGSLGSELLAEEFGGMGGAGFGPARSRDDRMAAFRAAGIRSAPEDDPAHPQDHGEGGVAEEIRIHRSLEGVLMEFDGFRDRSDLLDSGIPVTEGIVRIRYRANGTCRPYQISILGARTGERFLLQVDGVGTPFLLRPGDPPPRRTR